MCIETALKQVGKAQFSTGSDIIFIIALIKYVHTWLMIIKAGKREGTGCFAASCTMGGSVNMSCTHIDQGPQCLPVELWKPSKKRSVQNRRSSLLAAKPYQSDMNMRKTKAMHATLLHIVTCIIMHHIVIFPCLSQTQSRIAAPAPGTMYRRAARFVLVTEAVGSWRHWNRIWSTTDFWWKKSCTSWDVKNLVNNGYLSTGAGFLPLTAVTGM